jgi:hypothetical protein
MATRFTLCHMGIFEQNSQQFFGEQTMPNFAQIVGNNIDGSWHNDGPLLYAFSCQDKGIARHVTVAVARWCYLAYAYVTGNN